MSWWNAAGEMRNGGCVCGLQADDLHRDRSGGGAGCDGSHLLPAGQIFS